MGSLRMQALPIDSANTTVVDVTYLCNAACKYCQWGSGVTPGRTHRTLEEVLIPEETLRALGTQRIVISGGEPRLNPYLNHVLSYYRQLVDQVIVITNGYGLDSAEISTLLQNGATGITVSLDSIFSDVTLATRETPPALHARILSNLRKIAEGPSSLELGINSVVSHPTSNWHNVRALLQWGLNTQVDFVKFQPVFDDGYVGQNAPELKLSPSDVQALQEIAESVDLISHPPTNPPEFWKDLAELASGEELNSRACGLGPRHSILTGQKLNICYWLDSASFGVPSDPLPAANVANVRSTFEDEKLKCKVGFHCFCTQNIGHKWKEPMA
jgi:molybdenum cofactor biosynthesis enzyme MoaA